MHAHTPTPKVFQTPTRPHNKPQLMKKPENVSSLTNLLSHTVALSHSRPHRRGWRRGRRRGKRWSGRGRPGHHAPETSRRRYGLIAHNRYSHNRRKHGGWRSDSNAAGEVPSATHRVIFAVRLLTVYVCPGKITIASSVFQGGVQGKPETSGCVHTVTWHRYNRS